MPPSPPLKISQTCGDLSLRPQGDWYRHTRMAPPRELSDWVQHFWIETWDVKADATERRTLLPQPSVHLTFAPGHSRVFGIQLGRFPRSYRGEGRVFGIRFLPGGFYPFFRRPLSSIANSSIAAQDVFADVDRANARIMACEDDFERVKEASDFLLKNLPPPDPDMKLIQNLVAAIATDRDVTRVHQLLSRFNGGERTLQRLFGRYVGASPRWVIKRYRAYEAIDYLNSESPPLADLAQQLGYFDQAHFANDFRKKVGRTPSKYQE